MTTSTDTPTENQRLLEASRLLNTPNKTGAQALTLSRLIVNLLQGRTLHKLASALGTTSGTLHHYGALTSRLAPGLQRALELGRIGFKEARAFVPLPIERQPDLATPFVTGQLSSVDIEHYIRIARRNPGWDHHQVTAALRSPPAPEPAPPDPVPAPVPAAAPPPADPGAVVNDMLTLAGRLQQLHLDHPPEITRLRITSAARTLTRSLTPWTERPPQ